MKTFVHDSLLNRRRSITQRLAAVFVDTMTVKKVLHFLVQSDWPGISPSLATATLWRWRPCICAVGFLCITDPRQEDGRWISSASQASAAKHFLDDVHRTSSQAVCRLVIHSASLNKLIYTLPNIHSRPWLRGNLLSHLADSGQ